jgi:uncharacterized protein (TIGR02466 family)
MDRTAMTTDRLSVTTAENLALFPTRVQKVMLTGVDEDFNDRMAELVLATYRKLDQGRPGGEKPTHPILFDWTSDADLHVQHDLFRDLCDVFIDLAERWVADAGFTCDDLVVTECWANLAHHGGGTYRHHHRGAYLSGVYYPVFPARSGDLILHDPRGARVQLAPTGMYEPGHSVSIAPEPGMMDVFPAWLEHSVGQNLSGADRISIACNVVPTGPTSSPRAAFRPRLTIE